MGDCLDLEATHHVHTGLTEDHREAAKAFVEKRTRSSRAAEGLLPRAAEGLPQGPLRAFLKSRMRAFFKSR